MRRSPPAPPTPARPDPGAIRIRGAREHNLQGVDLDIPRGRMSVFTGVSGSGKSSLAFDTLFAEGQRRYVESLSTYARQFLGQMEKPRYDAIQGLTPTIAVSQGGAGHSPRSTVGTLTEVHDFLRVLWARAGVQHCTGCDRPVTRQSAGEIVRVLLALPPGTRLEIRAPVVRDRKGTLQDVLEEIRRSGFSRVRVDGTSSLLDDLTPLDGRRKHDLDVVVDRLVLREGIDERLADSVETALAAGRGTLICDEGGEARTFSERLTCPDCGLSFPDPTPASFSFNSPQGMCPACNGLGRRPEIDPHRVVPDESLSVEGGAIEPWARVLSRKDSWNYRILAAMAGRVGFRLDVPWRDLAPEVRDLLLHGSGEAFAVDWSGKRGKGEWRMTWEGVVPAMARRLQETRSEAQRAMYLRYLAEGRCTGCGGGRLRPESAAVRVGPWRIADLCRLPVGRVREAVEVLDLPGARGIVAAELVREIAARLGFLVDVGLGYLELDRPGASLSGGEAQRIRLASQLGGELTGVTYVLDEPTVGLHAQDVGRLVGTLHHLRDLGNTVVVVEHEPAVIRSADHAFDFGPGAGVRGGRLVYAGTPAGLAACPDSITGRYLSGDLRIEPPVRRRTPAGPCLRVEGARAHNLRSVDVEIPLGLFVAVSGVSGAGKSTLVAEILSPALHDALHGARRPVGAHDRITGLGHLAKVIDVDQGPIGRSPRSNAATYTGVWDLVREVFAATAEAKARGFRADRFSFNRKGGRCEACSGDGSRRIEMHFLPDVFVPCEVCAGKRFDDATLAVRYRGRTIADVLETPVEEALGVFEPWPDLRRILQTLVDVGLGYLALGQPASTLSGGEAQRVKLARELARPAPGRTLYILDEPTTGLHPEDVRHLLDVLDRIVAAGHTVLVVEHDLDVIRRADWVIDLGPGGGAEGGRLVVAGPPEVVAATPDSATGRALAGKPVQRDRPDGETPGVGGGSWG